MEKTNIKTTVNALYWVVIIAILLGALLSGCAQNPALKDYHRMQRKMEKNCSLCKR